MKKIKYLLAFILFFIGFSFSGESFMLYLDTFEENFPQTTLFKPVSVSDEEMKSDLTLAANRNNIQFFAYQEKLTGAKQTDIYIYTTQETKEELKNHAAISEKEYKSLLLGKATIHLEDWQTIPQMETVDKIYLLGDEENLQQFKSELVDKYAGNFPRMVTSSNESARNVLFVWMILLILLLFFTYYDILFMRKEILVKVVFGEELKYLVLKNILIDTFLTSVFFVSAYFFTSFFTNTRFERVSVLIAFSLFLLFNAALYTTLFRTNLKEAFSNTQNERRLLLVNYMVKVVSLLLTITVTSSCLALFSESWQYAQQKDFFKIYQNFSYVKLHLLPKDETNDSFVALNEQSANLREQFYQEYANQSLQLVNLSYADFRITKPTVLLNSAAIPYLIEQLPELRSYSFTEGIHYFFPKKYQMDQELQQTTSEVIQDYIETSNHAENFSTYEDSTKIMSIDGKNYFNRSRYLKNPIIILNHTLPDASDLERNLRRAYYAYDVMYQLTDDAFDSFIKQNHLENELAEKTNVEDVYQYHWQFLKRSALIATVLFFFTIFLEMIVLSLVLKLEYRVHAMELSLKKLLGYSIWSRNQKMTLMTLSASLLSTISAIVMNQWLQIAEARYILYGGLLVLVVELLFIAIHIKRMDQSEIPKILKGGAL